jgi:beta-glucosidase
VEGGNHNQWSVWELETANDKASRAEQNYKNLPIWSEIKKHAIDPANYVSGKAADHFNLYEQDFKLAKSMNLNAMRSGIEWSRVEPEEGQFSEEALEHYKKYFEKMRESGLQPIITLWHWTMPVWFAEKGGFSKRSNIKYFVRYVKKVTEALGEQMKFVITINEPTVYALYAYKEGRWPPQSTSLMGMHEVLVNLATAHKRAYKVIKKSAPKAQVGLAHNCAYFYAVDDSVISKLSAWVAHKYSNEYFIGLVKRKQDFLGINYYFAFGMQKFKVENQTDKLNDLGWAMEPEKMQLLLEKMWGKYKLPIMVTESGVADQQDQYRKWWIEQSIEAMNKALNNGVKMTGYIHWSLLDNFEWAEGFWPRFGLIEVDYKTMERKVRKSAKTYSAFIQSL